MRDITPESVRQAAKDLRQRHQNLTGADLKHTHAIELVATSLGYANRHTLMAALSPMEIPAAPVRVGEGGPAAGHEMIDAIETGITRWLGLTRRPDLNLGIRPEEFMLEYAVLAHGLDPKELLIALVKHNDAPFDFFEDGNEGELVDIRTLKSQQEMDDFIQQQEAAGRVVLPVQRYAHGQVHYSIRGTRNYPDMRFDVAGLTHFYLPPDDVSESHLSGSMSRENLLAFANGVLEQYSKWANGDTWTIRQRRYTITPEGRVERLQDEPAAEVVGEDEVANVIADMLGCSHEIPGLT
mgnify:CR=1 FL=1